MMTNQITVAVPTWNVPGDLLSRAVSSILDQTHGDLTVVVVNDGGDPPWAALAHVDDPRLHRVDLPTNRGAFWARQVVLAAATTPWWATVDADDWTEPTMYERLLEAASGCDGAMCGRIDHTIDGRTTARLPRRENIGKWSHVGSHCSAIWNTRFLQQIGGYHPDRRLGDDSRVTNAAFAAGNIATIDDTLYHYQGRRNSLTTSKATRRNSPARRHSGTERRKIQRAMQRTPIDRWPAITATSHPVEFAADVDLVRTALTEAAA